MVVDAVAHHRTDDVVERRRRVGVAKPVIELDTGVKALCRQLKALGNELSVFTG